MVETWIDRQEAEEASKFKEPFDSVKFPKRFWEDHTVIRYKVYSDPQNFVVVTAQTAARALADSGLDQAYRIERYILEYELEVDDIQLTEQIDMYERPILDTISENNPVVSSKILNGVMAATDALLADNQRRQDAQNGAAAVQPPEAEAPAEVAGDVPSDEFVAQPAPQPVAAPQPEANDGGDEDPENDGVSFDDAMQAPSLKNIMSGAPEAPADDNGDAASE